MKNILLVDDEVHWLKSLSRTLLLYGITEENNIRTARNGSEALCTLESDQVDIVFLDLIMERESGADLLKIIKAKYPQLCVVIMTGVTSITLALGCLKDGAADYLVKNMPVDELIATIGRITRLHSLECENSELRKFKETDVAKGFETFLTTDAKMLGIIKYMKAVAASNEPILITGESGTGKGVLAKAAANYSRPSKPFVSVNAAGLDSQMFSDTLFGHVRGAYTSADTNRQGMVQVAKDGTLFLDEIGDLPLQSQIKLLYLLQDGEFRQLGSDHALKTNARFIFATNRDLTEKQKTGEFRNDLYFRLNTHHINVPPLRDRRGDIPLLIKHFLEQASLEYKKNSLQLPDHVMELLKNYDYPGNVRQLRAIVYDAAAKCDSDILTLADFSINIESKNEEQQMIANHKFIFSYDKLPLAEEMIGDLIAKAMKLANGNQAKAAVMIGLSQPTISRKLRKN